MIRRKSLSLSSCRCFWCCACCCNKSNDPPFVIVLMTLENISPNGPGIWVVLMVIFSVFVSPCPWPSTFFSFTSTENVPSLLFDTVCVTEELPAFKMIWEEESVGLLASIETSVTFSSFFSSSSSSSSSLKRCRATTFVLAIYLYSTFGCLEIFKKPNASSTQPPYATYACSLVL